MKHKILDNIEHKWCNSCKNWRPLLEFSKCKNNWDKLHTQCKECNRQYGINHKEHKEQYDKHYRVIKKKDIAETSKQYHISHRDEILERKKLLYIEKRDNIVLRKKKRHASPVLFDDYAFRLNQFEDVRKSVCNNFLETTCAYCGRWLQPTNQQVRNRLTAINTVGSGEHRFYCSENCKHACPIYRQVKYPKGFKKATSREVVPLLRQLVLERDDYICQKCGATTETAQLHVHHILSYMLNKMMANDPDNCITLCKNCHKEIYLHDGCRYADLRC